MLLSLVFIFHPGPTMQPKAMFFCTRANFNFSRPMVRNNNDDVIDIVCPGEVGGNVVRITMNRSSLQRSPTLIRFFQSTSYRAGCGMTLHFTQVPGACFSLVKEYLDKGPDRYTKDCMVWEVSSSYTDAGKRFEIYSRLHKCARKLELPGLKNLAWEALVDEESSLRVEHCVTLASFIFANQAGFGKQLMNWLMGHIKRNFEVLDAGLLIDVNPDVTWDSIVKTLSHGFQKDWNNLVLARKSRLSLVEEEKNDEQEEHLVKTPQTSDDTDLETSTADEEDGIPDNTAIDSIIEVPLEKDDSEEWEDLDHLCPGPDISRAADDTKAREVLGAPMNPRFSSSRDRSPPRHSSFDLETAKARMVMGINSPSMGTIAGRRKQPRLTRAAKSFSSLVRSPSLH